MVQMMVLLNKRYLLFALFAIVGTVTIFAQLTEPFFIDRLNGDNVFHIRKFHCNWKVNLGCSSLSWVSSQFMEWRQINMGAYSIRNKNKAKNKTKQNFLPLNELYGILKHLIINIQIYWLVKSKMLTTQFAVWVGKYTAQIAD